MRFVSLAMVLLVGGLIVVGAAYAVYQTRAHKGLRRVVMATGGVLVVIGAAGFFGSAVAALEGFRWVPSTWEWPAGFNKDILDLPDGRHAVPLTAAGRIQIYDSEWRFQKGWWVDASAGTFKLNLAEADKIEVITARQQLRYVFDPDGTLVSKGIYEGRTYSDFGGAQEIALVPTRWWLWSFTSPIYSWILFMLGMICGGLGTRIKKRK